MSRIFLFASALFIVAACVAAFSAPFDGMGAREILYARFVLIGPALLIGVLVSALAVIMQKLDRLIVLGNAMLVQAPVRPNALPQSDIDIEQGEDDSVSWKADPYQPVEQESFEDRSGLQAKETAAADSVSSYRSHGEVMLDDLAKNVKIEDRRAPTVDEFLGQEKRRDEPEQDAVLMREGTFAGRNYRMYEDGSLEIDTDQSTIRFESLDEFRSFISNVSKSDD